MLLPHSLVIKLGNVAGGGPYRVVDHMDTIAKNTRGLSLLLDLNWDRFFFAGAIAAALGASVALSTVAH